ncbi:MAG: hypothetical protein ACPHK8_05340 [Thermoplasmatota archaeon]
MRVLMVATLFLLPFAAADQIFIGGTDSYFYLNLEQGYLSTLPDTPGGQVEGGFWEGTTVFPRAGNIDYEEHRLLGEPNAPVPIRFDNEFQPALQLTFEWLPGLASVTATVHDLQGNLVMSGSHEQVVFVALSSSVHIPLEYSQLTADGLTLRIEWNQGTLVSDGRDARLHVQTAPEHGFLVVAPPRETDDGNVETWLFQQANWGLYDYREASLAIMGPMSMYYEAVRDGTLVNESINWRLPMDLDDGEYTALFTSRNHANTQYTLLESWFTITDGQLDTGSIHNANANVNYGKESEESPGGGAILGLLALASLGLARRRIG